MVVKLFLLGRPGSGKSTTARHIEKYLHDKGLITQRFKDYDILQEMSKEDQYSKNFKKTFYKDFEVIDVLEKAILDKALQILNARLHSYLSTCRTDEYVLIEFARGNYVEAFQNFSSNILQDSYFLFIDVDLNICIRRIEQRMIEPVHSDDHYTSQEVLQRYYVNQNFPLRKDIFAKSKVLKNQSSLRNFMKKVDNFVDTIFE